MIFEWDAAKEAANLAKHGVDFSSVGRAWTDPNRLIFRTPGLTRDEVRWQFVGWNGQGVLTVRFTLRKGKIRIVGAGYWRKQKNLYEEQKRKSHL